MDFMIGGILLVYSFGVLRNTASTVFHDTAFTIEIQIPKHENGLKKACEQGFDKYKIL